MQGDGEINVYDELPYKSYPFATSHPDRLATIAALFGLKCAPIDRCRVLEMGCAAGGNIIPMAYGLPGSTFVGVELSARQAEEGRRTCAALGLRNIELMHKSIEDIGPEFGPFDYIIAHGVYSWVPAAVRDKIVSVCKSNLAKNGIAYISYNTFPGWHLPQALREMMLYHIAPYDDAKTRAAQARALLRFLREAAESSDKPYSKLVIEEINDLVKETDDYIYHDHLSKVNKPFYFYEFVRAAAGHGLQYLADANLSSVLVANFPEKIAAQLRTARDIVQQEQYMDFLYNRRFRMTLLCHAGRNIQRPIRPERIMNLFVRQAAKPKSDDWRQADLREIVLIRKNGREFNFAIPPVLKAAMPVIWANAPRAVPFGELAAEISARGGEHEGESESKPELPLEEQLAHELLKLYLDEIVGLHVHSPDIAIEPGPRPTVGPLTRHGAAKGRSATNHWHEYVRLNPFERELALLLDGTRDLAAIVAAMSKKVAEAHAAAKAVDEDVPKGFPAAAETEAQIEVALRRFARNALLVPESSTTRPLP